MHVLFILYVAAKFAITEFSSYTAWLNASRSSLLKIKFLWITFCDTKPAVYILFLVVVSPQQYTVS